MEVIHLILGKANPNRMNGVNKVVYEMATRQVQAGQHVQVWGITKNVAHDYPARNFITKLFKMQLNPFWLDAALKKAMAKKKKDVVFHLHGGFVPSFYAAAIYLKKQAIPFVFTPHGSYNTIALQHSQVRKKVYFHLFEKKLIDAATVVHSLGKSEVAGLQKLYPTTKCIQIPYGFEGPGEEIDNKPAKGKFVVSFCGRFDIYVKGLDVLLKGFSMFHQQYPTSELWLIGDGEKKSRLQAMATGYGIEKAVIFTGPKFGKEKTNLLKQSHVFATTSRNEGLPTAVLEAASLGIPCLVTVATNTGESIKKHDAGFVIDSADSQQVFGGLTKLYQRIMVKEEPLAKNAIRMIREEYDWQNILRQYKEMYRVAAMPIDLLSNNHKKNTPLVSYES